MKKKGYGTWSSKMQFPYLDETIFLDIETDMGMKHVWLIGVKLNNIEEQFLAWNWEEETQILQNFSLFLAEHPSKPLVCYSTTNFDFRVLKSAASRLGLNRLIEQLNQRALIDMGTLLRRHFSPYGRSYSLKLLRFLIGYDYKDISMSGEQVAIEYYQQVRGLGRIKNNFAQQALEYNLDDIRILYTMIEKFGDNIIFTSNFTRDSDLQETRIELHQALYSSTVNSDYIRISVYKEDATRIMQKLMQHGVTLPVMKEGVNVTALYWRSRFSYSQMRNIVDDLNLVE